MFFCRASCKAAGLDAEVVPLILIRRSRAAALWPCSKSCSRRLADSRASYTGSVLMARRNDLLRARGLLRAVGCEDALCCAGRARGGGGGARDFGADDAAILPINNKSCRPLPTHGRWCILDQRFGEAAHGTVQENTSAADFEERMKEDETFGVRLGC